MKLTWVFIFSWTRCAFTVPIERLLAHAVPELSLGFLGVIKTWTWLRPALKRIDEWLFTSGVLGTSLSERRVLVVAWSWVHHVPCLKPIVSGDRPRRPLRLVFCWSLKFARSWHMIKTLVIYKLGIYATSNQHVKLTSIRQVIKTCLFSRSQSPCLGDWCIH